MAVIAAVNAVIAFGYYGRLALRMWVEEPHLGDRAPIKVPFSLQSALALTAVATVAFGVIPGIVTHFTDVPTDIVGWLVPTWDTKFRFLLLLLLAFSFLLLSVIIVVAVDKALPPPVLIVGFVATDDDFGVAIDPEVPSVL